MLVKVAVMPAERDGMAQVFSASSGSKPPTHAQLSQIADGARLAAVRELGLLDGEPDETIDRVTRLATELLGVPISLVTLLDADRQFFLSNRGLGGEAGAKRETPLSHSFCKYVVAGREPVIVDDAREDPILCDNLAVSELGVVAYAGMPLILGGGESVGAFCAIDTDPRSWSEWELAVLADLAAVVNANLELRAALVRQSLHDNLTGLPNRQLLVSSCDQLLAGIAPGERVAVACAGIDHFNTVNQAFGTENADNVLRAVSGRLQEVVGPGEVFGRLRGDVFVLVSPGVNSEERALSVGMRLHAALASRPLEFEGEPLSVRVTVGVANGGEGTSGADLISEAANAMREAKRNQGRVRVAEEGWTETAASQLRTREALQGALDRGELSVVFQPVVQLEGGVVRSFETLARWTHPELGSVSPEEFIPLAELTSDIVPIGRWVIEQATDLVLAARQQRGIDLVVGVNVSPLQLDQPDFAATLQAVCESRGLTGASLGIEITEGALLESGPVQKDNLERLKAGGTLIVLDDFGTGYSALGYLRDFAIDVIKIDRSFVERLASERDAAAVIQAILAMGRGMEIEIVAEGIETAEQAQILRLLGCRFGQGYDLGRPVSAAHALALLPDPD